MAQTANARADGPKAADVALGATIKAARQARAMSQSSLAAAIGVTFQQVQKYEKGSNRVSYSRLCSIADALDCPLAELAADAGASGAAMPEPVLPPEVVRLARRLAKIAPAMRGDIVAALGRVVDAIEGPAFPPNAYVPNFVAGAIHEAGRA